MSAEAKDTAMLSEATAARAPEVAPAVAIVVLNWNKAAETLECLQSLRAQDYPNTSVIVVDNGSATEDLAALRLGTAGCVLLCNGRNLGFAGGVNVGITRALADGASYVWLVNNDARVAPDALARLVAAAEADPRVGLASPVIRNQDRRNVPDFCAGLFQPSPLTFHMTADAEQGRTWHREHPDQIWLTGTALLIRRAVVERIGGFDERLFAYYEDNDYSLRAARGGFRARVVEDAQVFHRSGDPGGPLPSRPPYFHYYMARNLILLLRKHGTGAANARALAWALALQARERARFHEHKPVTDAIAAGVWDGLCGAGGEFVPGRRSIAGAVAIWIASAVVRVTDFPPVRRAFALRS